MKKLTLEQFIQKIKNRLSKNYDESELTERVDKKSILIEDMFNDVFSFIEVSRILKN